MKAFILFLIPLVITGSSIAQTNNATFVFTSDDAAGEGFDDQTASSDLDSSIVGDNTGETLGELRSNVLEAVGKLWGTYLLSDVPIEVTVDFSDLGGSSGGSIILAGAGALTVSQNFANAPLADTLYPIALANSLAGTDLSTSADITVTVNSNSELSNSQDGDYTWYYGLDNNAPSNTIDFLNVIAHELGHGLGFASFADTSTGEFSSGIADVYSTNIYDTSLGLSWAEMTDAQRASSATSDPDLTWNGPYVSGAINGVSSFVSQGTDSSASSSESFIAQQAAFGGALDAQGLSGSVILADDGVGIEVGDAEGSTADLAQEIINGAEVSGNIALIARGIEQFDVKVRRAEDAGAIGAIIYNNVDTGLTTPSAGGTVTEPTIPVLFVTLDTGNSLIALLSEGVAVTMFESSISINNDDGTPAATTNRLRLYAPSTLATGSSVSHWTTDASPNLIMEPSINSDLAADLDISVLLMKDIGWQTTNISIPHLTYSLWLEEQGLDTESQDIAENEDFDSDSLTNIEEYYHGSDPRAASRDQLMISKDGLTHQRSRTVNDIIVDYQTGISLDDFADFTVSESTTDISYEIEEANVDLDLDLERSFFRLSLERLEEN